MRKALDCALLALLLVGGMFASCRKNDDAMGPTREFMTTGEVSVRSGATSAVLSWREAINTDTSISSYTVEISRDSTFAAPEKFSYRVATAMLTVYDTQLLVRVPYYARVKTNGTTPEYDSKWVRSSRFSLTGEQIFLVVKDNELKHNSVILRWNDSTKSNLVKIILTPAGGAPTEYVLLPNDVDSSFKKIDGLTPSTEYHAQILSDTKEKGYIDFKTKEVPVYAYTLNSTMDISAVLDTCASGIIIGLDTGTYTPLNNCNIKGKTVTLMSVSGNPADTKIIFKEFKLMGNGAGLTLQGISLDGGGTALYVFNFGGLTADGDAASFANLTVENCRISNYGNCVLRANRGTNAGDHKIGAISFSNCVISNNLLTNLYTEFTIDKLAFQTLTVRNSTWYNAGRSLITAGTALPAGTTPPEILFDHNTINHLGTGGTRLLLDANANPVKATFTNNIIANSPRTGTLSNDMIRATGAGSVIVFSYNNYFKLMNGSSAALLIPAYVAQTGNLTADLGWTPTTTTFTLPASSPVRTGSSTGGPMGDPRWH